MNFLRETKPNLFIRYKVKYFFAPLLHLIKCGIPQGNIFGPLNFLSDLIQI